MDDIVTFADEIPRSSTDCGTPWKILIADDEPSVHLVTKLALGDFTFEGRKLELLSAYGEADTRSILAAHPDIALILLDVVMDSVDSGFNLVRYIRDTLGNKEVRVIMRTGQSGNAPEDRIIIDWDINDFKDKTELTVAKLRTTMISSLRTYSHLKIIADEQRRSQENRQYLHSIIDSLSSLLITLAPDGEVILWNQEAARWTGKSADQVVGHNLFEAVPVLSPLEGLFHEVARGDGRDRVEKTMVPLQKGGQAFAQVIFKRIAGAAGTEVLLRIDDRTEAKLSDDTLLRSHRLQAFNALIAGLSQELVSEGPRQESRTPSTEPSSFMERLARFATLTAGTRRAVDWSKNVRGQIEPSTGSPGGAVRAGDFPDTAWVGGSEQGLRAIFENLVTNAREALKSEAGTISVELRRRSLDAEGLRRHPDATEGPYWCLSVHDTGSGISREAYPHVFDPYFTTKPGAHGLGLALVDSVVESFGGFVDLTSEPGRGTSVDVYLPEWAPPWPEKDTATVLVCDDETLFRQMAGKLLKHLGYKVVEAEDGDEAQRILQEDPGTVKLVILDMVLPGRSGLDALDDLRRLAPQVPVILSSGFGLTDAVRTALDEKKLAGFLPKPYRVETLSQIVSEALDRV